MNHAQNEQMEPDRRFVVDLRVRPPRSPRLRLGPFILLARCLDKCRAHLAGVAGEYEYDSMIDRWLFAFKGITGGAFKAIVAEGLSDEGIRDGEVRRDPPSRFALWRTGA
jgi:hypothetical protein